MNKRFLLDRTRVVHNGAVEKQKQQEFFDLAERFRKATDPQEIKRLGDQLGRMVFGSGGLTNPSDALH